MEGIEVNCFICGSSNVVMGKCMNCGYQCEVEFACPYHNGSMRCNVTKKVCNKRLDYYDCQTYQQFKS
jgi:hypothetical protein